MKISQSLIKEVQRPDHCPKQIYYSFVEGKELIDPSEVMLLGRYFESELLGACRGGEIQEPNRLAPKSRKPGSGAKKEDYLRYIEQKTGEQCEGTVAELKEKVKFMPTDEIPGEKAKPFRDCDKNIEHARQVFERLGLKIEEGKSQEDLQSELLSGAIDHINKDLQNPEKLANYDLKWTATKEDDRWNGWGDPESMEDAKIQAVHYTLVSYEVFKEWRPFYFLVFGKDNWVKVIRFKITQEAMEQHKARIKHTADKVREYALNDFKGTGSFNKCVSCPFYEVCEDKATIPQIEEYEI